MHFDPRLLDFFDTHEISYKYTEHPALFSARDSLAEDIVIPGLHTKNLFLTDKQWVYYLVTVELHSQVAINSLRKLLWCKDLSFGSPEAMMDILHLTPGSVSMMGMLYGAGRITLIIDEQVRSAAEISCHPNRNDATITLTQPNLARLFDLRWVTPVVMEVPMKGE